MGTGKDSLMLKELERDWFLIETSSGPTRQEAISRVRRILEIEGLLIEAPERPSERAMRLSGGGIRRYVGEIVRAHVGHTYLRLHGQLVGLGGTLGRVQLIDVGKRLFEVDGVLQVENNEQRDERVASYSRSPRA